MQRNISLDLLKLILSIMVIGIHTNFLGEVNSTANYLSVNGVFRIAVPLFFIINGYYFFHVSSVNQLLQWLKRFAYLYAFWMLFFSYFWVRIPDFDSNAVVQIIGNILIGFWHLWYIVSLIGASIVLFFVKDISCYIVIPIVFLLYIVGVAVQYAGNYHLVHSSQIDTYFNYDFSHRNFLMFSVPFMYIGYCVNKFKIIDRISFSFALCFVAIGLFLLFGESYLNYTQPLRQGGFDNYLSLLFICPALFIATNCRSISGKTKQLSRLATAIYLIHPFFILLCHKYSFLYSIDMTPVVIILSVLASFIIVWAQRRVRCIL